ncbi:hypothetical protein Z517_04097 [Fonsecaea pedrosoi CBS 271.37]|uniref:T6SS Phospholipase effector Tle1-like catalytic domain-containing protein n=1 Tax=Fonsecaea pedrosoi CBS 271.37 TaxID=1442368 RepID=A0A0D2H938_9EURO|nr:uncharacterized protein Z517_04097 [Fonsecaea pedrosoi CBS 271.37]KIW81074.1 hypothetical protein Z517_04097 [Fonsecaea pedrosoi CBS 271.37]
MSTSTGAPRRGAAPTGRGGFPAGRGRGGAPPGGASSTKGKERAPAPSGRRFLIFCDGTGEVAPEKTSGSESNLAKLALSMAERGSEGQEQICFYQQGVGTVAFTHPIQKINEMTLGQGLEDHIKIIYNYIAPLPSQAAPSPDDHPRIQQGDTLCFFGFSRGAATARFAADFIATAGFPAGGQSRMANFDIFFQDWKNASDNSRYRVPQSVRLIMPKVECVGVFDTVEALGLPRSTQQRVRSGVPPTIPDLSTKAKLLHGSIQYGFQALALHEMRQAFLPEVWGPPRALGQVIKQTWFLGKHSDVGGGPSSAGPNSGLAGTAFRWMIAQLNSIGITVAATGGLGENLAIPEEEAGQGQVRTQGTFSGGIQGGQAPRTPGRYSIGMEKVHESVRLQGLTNVSQLPDRPALAELIGELRQEGGRFIWVNGNIRMEEDTDIAPPEGSTTAQATNAPLHPLPSTARPGGGVVPQRPQGRGGGVRGGVRGGTRGGARGGARGAGPSGQTGT